MLFSVVSPRLTTFKGGKLLSEILTFPTSLIHDVLHLGTE